MTDLRVRVDTPVERRRIVVRGVVQGVGFRPFVARLAAELELTGLCGNDATSVFIEAEGDPGALTAFCARLRSQAPPLASVTDVTSEPVPVRGGDGFRIAASRPVAGARTLVPPDVATCADCLRELRDPTDRRYRHPFLTCTNCGPRFTIITDLPYDRPATTMAAFEMCSRCRQEYADPGDRRFHAQPISCHDCGPRLWLEDSGGRIDGDDAVLAHVQRLLHDGAIVAVKGIGGFHLACDATNAEAVRTLRERKRRPDKPLAVMAPSLAAVLAVVHVSAAEEAALTQPARPIVLVAKRRGAPVAAGAAPGLDELGVMLPYTPLHALLFGPVPGPGSPPPPRLLVMTSGNLSDEPICHTDQDARDRLAGIADAFLMHDREIAVPCDDSVVAVSGGGELPIRRSRGFAPLPITLPDRGPVTLAVGAEVKNTFCLVREDLGFCSGHLGDMGSLESQAAFAVAVDQLSTLHAATPELLVADEHPGYATRHWAERHSARTGVPLVGVQHHHAHVASLLAEHGLVGTPVVGVAYDGTGYGCDQTVWGGEILYVGPDVADAVRAGHLQPFLLPGGDRAVRNPFRVALALLSAAGVDDADGLGLEQACPAAEVDLVRSQLASGVGCVETTSMGRLFDGVASLLGVRHRVTYEAQAAIELEALARSAGRPVELTMEVSAGQLQLGTLVRGLVDGVRAGRSVAGLALGFHRALAAATTELVRDVAREHRATTVGLTGGVFSNRLLLDALTESLGSSGLSVLTHQRVPANDGGLSLGQAVVGRAKVGRAKVRSGQEAGR